MTASPSGPNFPATQSTGPTPGTLIDTTQAPRATGSGSKRPAERSTTELLEPHWAAAIDAATD